MRRVGMAFAVAMSGCGPRPADFGGVSGEESGASSSTTSSTSVASSTTSSTSVATTTTSEGTGPVDGSSSGSGGSSETTIGGGFISDPDGGSSCMSCDPFAQDCSPGEKCIPEWHPRGLDLCGPTKCFPVVERPAAPGEICTLDRRPGGAHDDCDATSVCWNIDADTGEGTCVALCTGSIAQPQCEGGCTACWLAYDGHIPLCLPVCDPLASSCPPGSGCYFVEGTFGCAPDASADEGAAWTPCTEANQCDPGLWCGPSDAVPACEKSSGCCLPACDADDPEPCPGAPPGDDFYCLGGSISDAVLACLPEGAGLCTWFVKP